MSSDLDKPIQDHENPEKSGPVNPNFRWYVIKVATGYENKVVDVLQQRVEGAGMSPFFGEALVPTEEVIEVRAGQKRNTKRKFFPGYILMQMDMTDDAWHFARNLPNVHGFVGGTRNRPMPISDKEAQKILNRVSENEELPKHKIVFETGEVVRVTDGPFSDFNGVVEDVNYEKSRLVVSVLIFGRSTPVELEFSQVEKSV